MSSSTNFKKYFCNKNLDQQADELCGAGGPTTDWKDGELMIVVIPSGWVFIGFCYRTAQDPEVIMVKDALNIHKWGTERGLGQIAINGPTKETILMEAGNIYGKPLFLMKADLTRW